MLTADEVQWILDDLCRNAGFCLPMAEQEKLKANPPMDPIAFTDAVFLAEGLKPELAERHIYRGVHSAVVQFFRRRGYDVDDATPNNRSRGP